MKNVITNQQNAVSGFPAAPPSRMCRESGFQHLPPSAAWHATMLPLLVFVFQVPTFPVRVTGSFEVLAFTPVPQLIFLKKGTNCCSCRVGGAGVDCHQSSREGCSQEPGRRTGPARMGSPGWGGDGDLSPLAWWELWYSLHVLGRRVVFPAPQLLLAPLLAIPWELISKFCDKTML